MSPDRRATNFQKAFYGRRKHDPKPEIPFKPEGMWKFWNWWMVGIAVGFAAVLIVVGMVFK